MIKSNIFIITAQVKRHSNKVTENLKRVKLPPMAAIVLSVFVLVVQACFFFAPAFNEHNAGAMGRFHGPFPPTYSRGLVT